MAMSKTSIRSVVAQQVYTKRTHPGVEAIVTTEGGHVGRAICTAGQSVGTHEVEFAYDGGDKWGGRGVTGAIHNIHNIIAPALVGMDASRQYEIDRTMLSLRPDAKAELGGNALAAVSAAALKAGAEALGIPLYRHLGGESAMYLPVPGVPAVNGHERWDKSVVRPMTKPTYSFMLHGFSSFAEASYTGWELQQRWAAVMKVYGIGPPDYYGSFTIPRGIFHSDEEIWYLMGETIAKAGFEGRVGLQADIAADTYYDRSARLYRGLFSETTKDRDALMELYTSLPERYPFVILEDPFHEDDFESHAELTRRLEIQIVGDDLFTTNIRRVQQGLRAGAANTVLLKVNQIGTISEAMDMVQFAYRAGYGVMPCESRGEGSAIADYCVGLNACAVREMATGETGNRFLEIERELGGQARFLGTAGLRGKRFRPLLAEAAKTNDYSGSQSTGG